MTKLGKPPLMFVSRSMPLRAAASRCCAVTLLTPGPFASVIAPWIARRIAYPPAVIPLTARFPEVAIISTSPLALTLPVPEMLPPPSLRLPLKAEILLAMLSGPPPPTS